MNIAKNVLWYCFLMHLQLKTSSKQQTENYIEVEKKLLLFEQPKSSIMINFGSFRCTELCLGFGVLFTCHNCGKVDTEGIR